MVSSERVVPIEVGGWEQKESVGCERMLLHVHCSASNVARSLRPKAERMLCLGPLPSYSKDSPLATLA